MDAAARLAQEVARHPYPLVFATVSGAHLYGFPQGYRTIHASIPCKTCNI